MGLSLKPCPFCGSDAELEHGNDHHGEWYNLGCSKHWGEVTEPCHAGRIWYTETEVPVANAVTAWNTRSEATEAQGRRIGDLQQLLEDAAVALHPFALEAMEWSATVPAEFVPECGEPDGPAGDAKFSVGDLRRAAQTYAALNFADPKEPNHV